MSQEEINEVRVICDSHQEQMDEELQALLQASSQRILKLHQKHFQPQIEKLQRQIAEQNLRNEATKKRGNELDTQAGKNDLIIDRFCAHIAFLRIKQRSANQRSKIFKAWKDFALDKLAVINLAQKLYTQEPMKRILFRRWVRRMRKVRSLRLKRELRRQCQMDLRSKETEATQRITSLQSELLAVNQLLAEHEKQHDEMQKKLRRAFMRGVTNLNLEAMDVFGEIPTSENTNGRNTTTQNTHHEDSDDDDFYVEPAPRISVIRHR